MIIMTTMKHNILIAIYQLAKACF